MYDVWISVVCTNNRGALAQCLTALPGACAGLKWRATVTDNAGEDGTSHMVKERFPWADLLRNERRLGFAANHNRLLARVVVDGAARFVLILNDDTIFDENALSAMVREMDARPRLGALGPQLRGLDGRPQQSLFRFPSLLEFVLGALSPGREPARPHGDGWLNGSCVLLRTEALREVGLLDERFFIFYEDTDLGLRLHQAGWPSALARAGSMVHLEHQTVSVPALNSVMARQMRRSQWLYVQKHEGRLAAAALEVVTRTALLARALKAVLKGRRSAAAAEREKAHHLLELARYRVSVALPHERSG